MKALKYILHILAFMLINIIVTFIAPSIVSGRAAVCTAIGIALALEYVYIWFFGRGYCFALPLSYIPVLLLGAFYFNNPSNPDMGLGMWVLLRYLTVPYMASAVVVSTVMKIADVRISKSKK